MSIKAATFASIITNPMNTYKFEISIPDVNYTTIVESTTFPAQGAFRQVDLYMKGEKVSYPALPENGDEWSFKIPESDNGIIKAEFDKYFSNMYDQKTGQFTPVKWKDIIVTAQDLADNQVFSVTLHGAWIKKRGNVDLNAAEATGAWKWDYTFYYNWLEDNEIHPSGTTSPLA